jgi:hypothetical protein
MFLYPRQYVGFLDGRMADVAVVAFLPGHLAARMPTLSTDVRIGREYALKMWTQHHLGHSAFGLIQSIINDGWCTKSRENELDFLYVDLEGESKRYILGLKSARGGQETWITTLHVSNEQQIRRRVKQALASDRMVRGPEWSE